MKKQILSKEFRRMQKLAGIITENNNTLNQILDKISDYGLESLDYDEKEYLEKYAGGEKNPKDPYMFDELIDSHKEVLDTLTNTLPEEKEVELEPVPEYFEDSLKNIPPGIKNLFPLKKGDYKKFDTFNRWFHAANNIDPTPNYVAAALGPGAFDIYDQTCAIEVLTYLNHNKFTTPEITTQYLDAITAKYF